MRRLIITDGATIAANPSEQAILAYYANSIRHLLP